MLSALAFIAGAVGFLQTGSLTSCVVRIMDPTENRPTVQWVDSDQNSDYKLQFDGEALRLSHGFRNVASFKTDGVTVNELRVSGAAHFQRGIVVKDQPQWYLYEVADFADAKAAAFIKDNSLYKLSECAGVRMLGGYGVYGNGEVVFGFEVPEHSLVRVRLRLHIIDQWNGETAFVRANAYGDSNLLHVWTKSFATPAKGVNVCGNAVVEGNFAEDVEFLVNNAPKNLLIGVGSTLEINAPFESSFGISRIELYLLAE